MPTLNSPAAVPEASAIVAWAVAQVGKAYVWGGTGPNGFDCSGLTSQAYLHGGGITIPRVAAAQQSAGTPINESELQPADLVFIGTPAFHVAMYAGSGDVVAADNPSVPIRVRAFNPSEWTGGFRRMANLASGGGNALTSLLSSTPVSGPLQALEGVNAIAQSLTSGEWWKRIGKAAIAFVVIMIGFVILNRKRIEKTLKEGATVAAVAA
jgi:cell wall-associated NlpC family hydrolase